MWFGLLGPLTVVDDEGRRVAPAGTRQRTLLAALLLHANTPVAADVLVEAVWGVARTATSREMLRSAMMRLRRALGDGPGDRIRTRAPGYVISLDGSELDVRQFEQACREVGPALRTGAWAQASETAQRALALWRGAPLLDVSGQMLHDGFAPRLEQLRVQLLEDRIEAELRLGRHDDLVAQLRELTAQHPLRERFHTQLVLALARGGCRAQALQAYQDARRVLVDELGIEPGPELRAVQERILAGDGELPASREPDRPPAGPEPAARTSPRRLPAAVRHFTGRHAEVDALIALRHEADAPGGTVVISAIDGMAGIGKTALAVHAAHRMAERFPDGQLFLDLHGHTRGYPPRAPGEALEAFLRALGVAPQLIPRETDDRAALYRERLAGTRTLIVLDNAADEAQVRPLLPGSAGCLVLITSRRRLKGLDDAYPLSLDVLPSTDALALLRSVAGPERVAAGDPVLAEIAELCGRLPLALRIAAALLRHRPAWSPHHLAELLHKQHRRVRALSDGERDLGAVFDLSYTGLDDAHGLLFRRLALVPGPDVDACAAAALLNLDPDTATGLLEDLVDHNLLIAHAPGRYRLHDLLRAHAAALAAADPQPDRDAAVDRLLHYYAHTAQSASTPIARCPRPAPLGPAPAHIPDLPGPEAARDWLRAERENLEAAFNHARASTLSEHILALAAGLAEILRHDGPFTQALILHQDAVETAERRGLPDACATALAELGYVRYLIGDFSAAGEDLRRAVEMYRALGHHLGEANALTDLGRVRRTIGEYPAALDALSQASNIYRVTGHRDGEANALAESGHVRYLAGDFSAAGEDLRRAVEMYRALGHHLGEANALASLGSVQHLTGDLPGALDTLTTALETHRAIGNRNGEALALTSLGDVRTQTGDYPAALDALTVSVEIHRALGNRNGEALALTGLGYVRTQTGDYSAALDALAMAAKVYRALGNRNGEAVALTHLGDLRVQSGDYPAALGHISQALDIYRTLGTRANEAWALNHYAAAFAAAGDLPEALELYRQALTMNRELNKPDDEAIALEGLGECHLALGEAGAGAPHLHQALEIFQRLGLALESERVRTRLADLTAA